MIKIRMLPLGPMQTNCYVVACEETGLAAVIDPSWDGPAIQKVIEEEGWTVSHILLTHCHFDHIGALTHLYTETSAPIYVHPEAVSMLRESPRAAALWGVTIPDPPEPHVMLQEGQIVEVGQLELQVLYTPGHAPGHVSFYHATSDTLFDGDVLFQQGIGRTDLPGGDFATLMRTIREKLFVLPDETRVYCGHGNPTTIGDEKRLNPFLQE
ncbi:MAG TPA: MBL fold metallo-hydrolase [Candidatus Sulfomarinibacteraceae bacterium]|nr:MBL fold metallo-hydrolase [Candidatus Sulfomarinibacteraceae bacterium]